MHQCRCGGMAYTCALRAHTLGYESSNLSTGTKIFMSRMVCKRCGRRVKKNPSSYYDLWIHVWSDVDWLVPTPCPLGEIKAVTEEEYKINQVIEKTEWKTE